MTKTLANGYSSDSTHQERSNEYQHDRVLMILKKICILMLWTKVASALEGLTFAVTCPVGQMGFNFHLPALEKMYVLQYFI